MSSRVSQPAVTEDSRAHEREPPQRGQSPAPAIAATTLAIGALLALEFASAGTDLGQWDLLFVSGCLTVIGGLWLARGQRQYLDTTLERLADRGALKHGDEPVSTLELHRVKTAISLRAERSARRAGPVTALVIAAAFVAVNATRDDDLTLVYTVGGPLIGALGGFLVGRSIGRMLSYGLLVRYLESKRFVLETEAAHIDGAAGLKPLGDFYFHQAFLLALPAVFLLTWSLVLLMPTWDDRYSGWREWYVGLLAIAIFLEVTAFAAPLWRVHEVMKHQKRRAIAKADTYYGPMIDTARAELEQPLGSGRRAEVREQLEQLASSYQAIEAMPTWPIDRTIRRRLTLGNVVLIVPLVTQVSAFAGDL